MNALLAACPTFETFWQGRLIPGACVDTLPFIRGVRCKRSAAAKDLLPDEVFSRIRCARAGVRLLAVRQGLPQCRHKRNTQRAHDCMPCRPHSAGAPSSWALASV
jgi:hypothetical protein